MEFFPEPHEQLEERTDSKFNSFTFQNSVAWRLHKQDQKTQEYMNWKKKTIKGLSGNRSDRRDYLGKLGQKPGVKISNEIEKAVAAALYQEL